MAPSDFPQMWELLPLIDRGTTDEAADLAAAELAGIGWLDRVRAMVGEQVRVGLPDRVVTGSVGLVFTDAFTLNGIDGQWLLPGGGIAWVIGPTRAARGPTGRQRGSGLSGAREWVGAAVSVGLPGGQVVADTLHAVGADHIAIGAGSGVRIVPWRSLQWLRRQ